MCEQLLFQGRPVEVNALKGSKVRKRCCLKPRVFWLLVEVPQKCPLRAGVFLQLRVWAALLAHTPFFCGRPGCIFSDLLRYFARESQLLSVSNTGVDQLQSPRPRCTFLVTAGGKETCRCMSLNFWWPVTRSWNSCFGVSDSHCWLL